MSWVDYLIYAVPKANFVINYVIFELINVTVLNAYYP